MDVRCIDCAEPSKKEIGRARVDGGGDMPVHSCRKGDCIVQAEHRAELEAYKLRKIKEAAGGKN